MSHSITTDTPGWIRVGLIPLLQLALALLVSSLVVLIIGENPWTAFKVMVHGAINFDYGLGSTLYYSTNFIFTGLAVALAFHAGLFNIGGEGQAYVAGLGVCLIALAVDSWMPAWLMFPLVIIGASLFGAVWGLIPGYLQAKRGSHIVVTTIMFNFIAAALMSYLLVEHIAKYGGNSTDSRYFAESAILPKLHELFAMIGIEFPYSLANVSLLLALVAAWLVWLLIWRTRLGYAIRVVGQNPKAAAYAGISRERIIIITMAIAGALAGLMAINEVYGAQGRLILNYTMGFGFIGIAVALMGRNHPVGIILAALLFGALYQGGTELQFEIPTLNPELIIVIQGLVVFFTGALERMVRVPVERLYFNLFSNRTGKAAAEQQGA